MFTRVLQYCFTQGNLLQTLPIGKYDSYQGDFRYSSVPANLESQSHPLLVRQIIWYNVLDFFWSQAPHLRPLGSTHTQMVVSCIHQNMMVLCLHMPIMKLIDWSFGNFFPIADSQHLSTTYALGPSTPMCIGRLCYHWKFQFEFAKFDYRVPSLHPHDCQARCFFC